MRLSQCLQIRGLPIGFGGKTDAGHQEDLAALQPACRVRDLGYMRPTDRSTQASFTTDHRETHRRVVDQLADCQHPGIIPPI